METRDSTRSSKTQGRTWYFKGKQSTGPSVVTLGSESVFQGNVGTRVPSRQRFTGVAVDNQRPGPRRRHLMAAGIQQVFDRWGRAVLRGLLGRAEETHRWTFRLLE